MVIQKSWRLVWPTGAWNDLKNVYDDLLDRTQSKNIASKVRNGIMDRSKELTNNPFVFETDRFKEGNENGEFRAFEKYSYRVTYLIEGNTITIIRVRYAGKEPLEY